MQRFITTLQHIVQNTPTDSSRRAGDNERCTVTFQMCFIHTRQRRVLWQFTVKIICVTSTGVRGGELSVLPGCVNAPQKPPVMKKKTTKKKSHGVETATYFRAVISHNMTEKLPPSLESNQSVPASISSSDTDTNRQVIKEKLLSAVCSWTKSEEAFALMRYEVRNICVKVSH